MPTGYTAAIADGIDFKTFVMQCARGMGALVMMRDEPMNAPIPERFEPSDYHAQKLDEAKERLGRLHLMVPSELESAAQQEFSEELARNREAIAEKRSLREKYKTMLDKVKAWIPPTPDHVGFKDFMIEQITKSIEFDCNDNYYSANPPVLKTGQEWLSAQIAKATRDIEYHTAEHAKEVERTESRNAWLRELRASLAALEGK